MRVLIAANSERSHLQGIVPLAWALRSQGHDVLVAHQPALTDSVTRAGLTSIPTGRDHQFWRVIRAMRTHGRPTLPPLGWGSTDTVDELRTSAEDATRWWWSLTNDPMIVDLVDLCRSLRPDMVIWGAATFAGSIAATALGIPHIRYTFGVDLFALQRQRFLSAHTQTPAVENDPLRRWLSGWIERFGGGFREEAVEGFATLNYFPPALRMPTGAPALDHRVVPMRYVAYNGVALVPDWIRTPPTKPRIVVTSGLSATDISAGGTDPVTVLTRVGVALGLDVIALVDPRQANAHNAFEEGVRIAYGVPLAALAPTCAAVVHHGGGGTVCTAAAYARPQLIVPTDFDEPILGRLLERQGSGIALFPDDVNDTAAEKALTTLLEDSALARSAEWLRDQISAMPAPSAVAASMPDLVDSLGR